MVHKQSWTLPWHVLHLSMLSRQWPLPIQITIQPNVLNQLTLRFLLQVQYRTTNQMAWNASHLLATTNQTVLIACQTPSNNNRQTLVNNLMLFCHMNQVNAYLLHHFLFQRGVSQPLLQLLNQELLQNWHLTSISQCKTCVPPCQFMIYCYITKGTILTTDS